MTALWLLTLAALTLFGLGLGLSSHAVLFVPASRQVPQQLLGLVLVVLFAPVTLFLGMRLVSGGA